MIHGASKVVVASRNQGKLNELAGILAGLDVSLVPQSEFDVEPVAEDGATFVENALIKARHAASVTGLPAIADDSGLVVDALGGRPGIYSARFAGTNASDRQNIEKLLTEMRGLADDRRSAAFHCAAVLVSPDTSVAEIVAEGHWSGRILDQLQGEGGFGYDPVFLDPDSGTSAACLSADEKNRRSHRGRAFRELEVRIRNLLIDDGP